MDAAQQIVVDALERAGVVMPPGIATVHDIGPASLISICSQALGLIAGQQDVYMPGSVPQSASVRFRLCTELSERVKQLGYRADLSFHQVPTEVTNDCSFCIQMKPMYTAFSVSCSTGCPELPLRPVAGAAGDIKVLLNKELSPDNELGKSRRPVTTVHVKSRKWLMSSRKEANESPPQEKTTPSNDKDEQTFLQLQKELEELQEKIMQIDQDWREATQLDEEVSEDEFSFVQEAVDLIKNDPNILEQLELTLEERKNALQSAQGKWERLEKERHNLQSLLRARDEEKKDKELEDISLKLKSRTEEHAALSSELERSPKQAPRSSYIRRITALVKNSKKQDADVVKIIEETRTLQRDNNSALERLQRIHLLVDERIFRDAKEDVECRLAYRLLSSMHESFTQLVDKVFEIDKIQRDIAELQASLETLEKQPVDVPKVQSDLDAIRRENSSLRKQM